MNSPVFSLEPGSWRFMRHRQEEGPRSSEATWSADFDPPELGAIVHIVLNGWEGCKGEVVGYRRDGEENDLWLMCCVRVLSRPVWHRREYPARDVCVFAGCELGYLS